jgi:hypothetical protein
MKMEEYHKLVQKAKRWDMVVDIVEGVVMAFFLLLLCGWFKPYL